MPLLGGAKASGTSFLDILLNGVGVGVQAIPAAGTQDQPSSQANPSDRSKTDDETQQTATLSAETSASSPIDPSAATEVLPEPGPGTAQVQTAGTADTVSSANPAPTTQPVDPNLGASAVVTTAQWLQKSLSLVTTALVAGKMTTETATKPTTTTGKTAAEGAHTKFSAADGKGKQVQAQAVPVQAMPMAVPVEPAPALPAICTMATTPSSKAVGLQNVAEGPVNQPNAPPAHVPQSSVPQSSVPQEPALATQNVQGGTAGTQVALIDGVQNVPVGPQNSATDGKSATQDGASGAQVNHLPLTAPASTFLSAALFPDGLEFAQTSSKTLQYKTSGITATQNPSISNAPTSASPQTSSAGTAKTSAQESASSSSRNQQNSGDGTQHAQADASVPVNTAAKTGDSNTTQAIAFGPLVNSHEVPVRDVSSAGDGAAHAVTEPSQLARDAASPVQAPASATINSARVIQSMSESEMRVGMRSSEFGDISIRTMVSQQQVQAQISVDHGELSSAISAHIPSIQAKFGDLGLHATIEVSQSGMSFSGERGQSAPREQRSFAQSIQTDVPSISTEPETLAVRATPLSANDVRLDIRA